MKMSNLYLPTLREMPADAEIASHKLLLRAGMIRKLVSGIYSYLPMGYRVIRKVEQITREEMDRAGAQELLMSAIQPKELWEASERWANFGPEMFRLRDRNEREFCLGPTHEEYFTNLIKDEIKSYKQLPLNLYQIQTKYRDEKRPRFGLMRCREFIMKDAYTFDSNEEGMKKSYEIMWKAYDEVFKRLKLKYKVVQGDTGAMGGKVSHEFMAMSDVGESLVAYCNSCDYAATDEKAEVKYNVVENNQEVLSMEKVHTPDIKTMEELVEFFKIDASNMVKSVVYSVNGKVVVALVPGDRELNPIKLCNYLAIGEHELEMASEELIIAMGSIKGFIGPVGLNEGTKVLVDSRVAKMKNVIIGSNQSDYHYKNANFNRDFNGEIVEDLIVVKEGDICPNCGNHLVMDRGIEVGNIFQLGTKYSDSLGAKFLDENGKEKSFVMGCYGIGVSRSVAAIVEQYHDDEGIIWPLVVAPYHAIITIVNVKTEEQMEIGQKIYDQLQQMGVEVLFDDRNERVGVKFKDRDLVGIPIRITVGKRAGEEIVEYSIRGNEEKIEVNVSEIESLVRAQFDKAGLKL